MTINSTETCHHKFPYIQAAQAQKHVTHNESLRMLDAVVQLSVKSRALNAPPQNVEDGARYLVASTASADWLGHDGQVAVFIDGVWQYHTPVAGWRAWIEDENILLVWNGSTWVGLSGASGDRLGINTVADSVNRLALKSDAALFSHDDVTPGTGDVRHTLNKAQTSNTVSQIYQTGFVGHAEIGLAGDDNLSMKVSPNGNDWHEAFVTEAESGFVRFPNGSDAGLRPNLLTNAQFVVNQRAFVGGALAADGVGHDRWKAGPAGASYTVSNGETNIASGALLQVVPVSGEMPQFVTFSIESISGAPLNVSVAGSTVTLPAMPNRQFAVLEVLSPGSGTITLELSGDGGATAFANPKLERGDAPSPFEPLDDQEELARCQRFFQIIKVSLSTGAIGQTVTYAVPLQPPMVRDPDLSRVASFVSSTEIGTQFTGGSTNSATSFGIFNSGTGGLGGVFHLNAEL